MYAVLCMAVGSVGRAKFIVKGLRVVSESKIAYVYVAVMLFNLSHLRSH